jgi:hypothetical protein
MKLADKPKERHITAAKVAKPLIVGLGLGMLSVYLISECDLSGPSRPRPAVSRSVSYGPRQETSTVELPYSVVHSVGGLELEYLKRDFGTEARIRYDISIGSVDTGLKLRQGVPVSVPLSETDLKVQVVLNRSDENRVNVTVSVLRAD